jgi:ribose-phosphate pyrophosphokinase
MIKRIDPDDVRFFSGRSHPELAQKIANYLDVPLVRTTFSRFSNDNLFIQLGATVRGRSVYVFQSLIPPVSENLMELFIMLDIARSAGASEVHAVIPYFSYARSDKKDAPRISITARLIADLLQTAGATHVMTMTLHSPQVHGFFSVPTDPLTARDLFVTYLKEKAATSGESFDPSEDVVIAPDFGRAGSAARLAASLGLPALSAEKSRISDTDVVIKDLLIRQVEGFKKAIIYDDEIATGGSMLTLCRLLVQSGIEEITVTCTHGLLIGDALTRILAIPQVKEIITTDTTPFPPEKCRPRLTVLSVAPVIGDAIWKNYNRLSIGSLFSYGSDEEDELI